MLEIGCVVLTFWCALNIVPSTWILFDVLVLGGAAPALTQGMSEANLAAAGPAFAATVNSVAVYANGLNVAFCLLFTGAIWKGIAARVRWAFWTCAVAATIAALAGVAGDFVAGSPHPGISVASVLILAAGFACCARGLFAGAAPRSGV